MKKIILPLVTCLLCICSQQSHAQGRDHALGVRLGPYLGVTYQNYMSDEAVLELIFASRWKGVSFTGLYEIHKDSFDIEGLQWYYGGGGHIGFYSYHNNGRYWNDGDSGSMTVIGVDGILGIEYFIGGAPIQLSLDWKPAFSLVGYTGFEGDNGALSVRFTF